MKYAVALKKMKKLKTVIYWYTSKERKIESISIKEFSFKQR